MRTTLSRLVGATVVAGGLALAVTACGDDSSDATDSSATASQEQSISTSSPTRSGSETTASKAETPAENSNAPAVPGPSLPPATSIPESKKLPEVVGTRCQTVNGPDGALHVVIFAGSSIDCGVAMPVAKDYAPMIASGKQQQVQGWDCGPSQTRGVISRCTKGSETIGFSIE